LGQALPPHVAVSNTTVSSAVAVRPSPLLTPFPLALAQARPVVAGPNLYEPSRVNKALSTIDQALVRSLPWERREQTARATSALLSLSPAERKSLVNLLATRPGADGKPTQLAALLDRALEPSVGLYDTKQLSPEQNKVIGSLVAGQDKVNLRRLFFSLPHREDGVREQPDKFQAAFAKAVASRGNDDQKLWLLQGLSADAIKGKNGTAARAIAQVMSSMDNDAVRSQAITWLGRVGMDAVVTQTLSAAKPAAKWARDSGHATPDLELFKSLASSLAKSKNAREKASFITACKKGLATLSQRNILGLLLQRPALSEVTRAMSSVIGSDVNGVIENTLAQNATDGVAGGAESLKQYVAAVLDAGRGKDLGATTLSLQRGNRLDQQPTTYLSQKEARAGQDPSYVRARVMGEWLGIIGSATQGRIASRDSNCAWASLLFSGLTDVSKEGISARFPAFKTPGGIGSAALKTAVNSAILSWRNEAARSDRDFSLNLYLAAIPKHSNGVAVTAEWTTTMRAARNDMLTR
jgi:hypothetical protein